MLRALVIADDVTGANATAGLFAEAGLRAATLWRRGSLHALGDRFDVLSVSTGSRNARPSQARRRVQDLLVEAPRVPLVVKRMDTTLRGNVGAEIEACLDTLRKIRGGDVRAVVVPAFPAAGRTCARGIQYVDGVPVAETPAARDPHSPVTTSRVAEVVARTSALEVSEAHTARLSNQELVAAVARATDAVVFDAADDEALARIAAGAARAARRRGVHLMAVDPGPFGPLLARALGLAPRRASPADPEEPSRGPVLVVAGSATDATLEQLAAAEEDLGARLVAFTIDSNDDGGPKPDLGSLLKEAGAGAVVGVRTTERVGQRVQLDRDQARRMLASLAGYVVRALRGRSIAGLYVTGGDMTHALAEALGAVGFEVTEEVLPLAVRGHLLGGDRDGLPVVTKGGLVGDRRAAVVCLQRLGAVRTATVARQQNAPTGGGSDERGAER